MTGPNFSRVTALISSVMDLHVRIALQEADREKRRLVGGGVMLGLGLTLMTLALVAVHLRLTLALVVVHLRLILPAAVANDFLRFCQLNPKPCPLIATSNSPGDFSLPPLGDVDIRTDVPSYRVFRDGEFVAILGPSGCGETTTLRLIAGFESNQSGSVRIDGEDIANVQPEKRPVNTVFQNYALFPHLSVADNIGFGLRFQHCPKDQRA